MEKTNRSDGLGSRVLQEYSTICMFHCKRYEWLQTVNSIKSDSHNNSTLTYKISRSYNDTAVEYEFSIILSMVSKFTHRHLPNPFGPSPLSSPWLLPATSPAFDHVCSIFASATSTATCFYIFPSLLPGAARAATSSESLMSLLIGSSIRGFGNVANLQIQDVKHL